MATTTTPTTTNPAISATTVAEPTGPALLEVVDRSTIEQLVHRLGLALDTGQFASFRDLLTEDSTASTPGGEAAGIDAVIAQASRNHDPALSIQHLITDVLVDLDGDDASVRANVVVSFADGVGAAPFARLGGVYRFAARRTSSGWRLSSVGTSPVWQEGEPRPPRP